MSKNHSKDQEIRRLKEKLEELETVKEIQQLMLAELQKDVGMDRLEKIRRPRPYPSSCSKRFKKS